MLKDVDLAKYFESLVCTDKRFEIIGEVTLGLVCFRLKGTNELNELNESLLKKINDEGKIYMVPSKINNIFFIRFAVCASRTEKKHIDFAWDVISKTADRLLSTR
jgi:glutamate/tyrosine decarboxylase-like PLP-dependent enzyme